MKGDRLNVYNVPLKYIVAMSYNVPNDSVVGAGWMETEGLDIVAKVPPGTTREHLFPMLQQLLNERLQLKFHHDQSPIAVYALVAAKGGPKLQPAAEGAEPGARCAVEGRNLTCKNAKSTMAELARDLPRWMPMNWFDLPVVDQTGLTAAYAYTISWERSNQRPDSAEEGAVPIFDALQQQLGLKIERRKAPLDRIIIDSAARVPVDMP